MGHYKHAFPKQPFAFYQEIKLIFIKENKSIKDFKMINNPKKCRNNIKKSLRDFELFAIKKNLYSNELDGIRQNINIINHNLIKIMSVFEKRGIYNW